MQRPLEALLCRSETCKALLGHYTRHLQRLWKLLGLCLGSTRIICNAFLETLLCMSQTCGALLGHCTRHLQRTLLLPTLPSSSATRLLKLCSEGCQPAGLCLGAPRLWKLCFAFYLSQPLQQRARSTGMMSQHQAMAPTNLSHITILVCLVAWLPGCLVTWLLGCIVSTKRQSRKQLPSRCCCFAPAQPGSSPQGACDGTAAAGRPIPWLETCRFVRRTQERCAGHLGGVKGNRGHPYFHWWFPTSPFWPIQVSSCDMFLGNRELNPATRGDSKVSGAGCLPRGGRPAAGSGGHGGCGAGGAAKFAFGETQMLQS